MKRTIIAAMVLSLAAYHQTLAQSNEQKGLIIAQQSDSLDNGWASAAIGFTMTLRNKSGQETVRKLHGQILEVKNDGDKSLMIFDNPVDVKGTASLVYTHKTGDDDQWLYLPALKQVKRISSSNKSGPFMGSEFAYEDMASHEVEKYAYKYVELSISNNEECQLVERYPVDKKSGYTKHQVWFNKSNHRIEKIDFYDRKATLVKSLTYHDYKLYLNKYWRATRMLMVNHQTGKQTELNFSEYKFGIGLTEEAFTQNSLVNAK